MATTEPASHRRTLGASMKDKAYWAMTPAQREARKEKMREYARNHRPEQALRDRRRKVAVSKHITNNPKQGKIKQYIATIKCDLGECTDCGLPCEEWNHCMFAFDHLDPTLKSFALSRAYKIAGMTRERIDNEIAKCELVCHNCHAFRTWIERQHDQNDTCDNDEREYLPLLELMQ
jgi:hypothetical protein